MISLPQPRPLTFQVTATILGLAVAMAGAIVAFGAFTMLRIDRDAGQKQALFVSFGIAEQRAGLAREEESVTDWDDAVTFSKANDQGWMAENLTVWLSTYYGHDRVYVLDGRDRPVQAMVDGALVAPERYAEIAPQLAAAVAGIRAGLASAVARHDAVRPTVDELIGLPDGPAMLGIMPIVANSDRIAQAPGSEYLHISIQRIDADLVGRLAEQYQLADARVLRLTETAAASVPIVDSHGVLLGFIGWTPDRPGLAFVRNTAPALLGCALFAAGLLWFLLRRLRRLSGLLHRSQEETNYLAFHDMLTRLPNRSLFDLRLRRAITKSTADGESLALLYLDLDRFKHINDTLGHAAGDELIRKVGERLRDLVHDADTVARLGGDEFAILLTAIEGVGQAKSFAGNVLASVARPYFLNAGAVTIGVSVGIAMTNGTRLQPEELLRRADVALYRAKRAGGDRHHVFLPEGVQHEAAPPDPFGRPLRSAAT